MNNLHILDWLSNNGKIILFNRALRSFGFGFMSIILSIYLKEIGVSNLLIGILLSASLIGGAVFTILAGRFAANYGIKKVFLLSLVVSLLGITIFILTNNYIFLLIASTFAFISPSGRELGPFLSLEQAYLPSAVSIKDRTKAFSFLNIASHLAASLGALIAGLPTFLQNSGDVDRIVSYKIIFILYLLLNILALILYTKISEVQLQEERKQVTLSEKSKKIITKLSLLFSLDSFAGGLVIGSLISLWFHTKFGAPLTTISTVFFIAGLLETVSFYVSGKLAEKIGLINTMVFTHIPGSIALILMSFMPTFYLAAFFYFIRQLLSEMDIPARQAYVISVVSAEERSRAASITNVSKIIASSISPLIASRILLSAASPFILAGVLKIFYDITLYHNFKHVKPLEE